MFIYYAILMHTRNNLTNKKEEDIIFDVKIAKTIKTTNIVHIYIKLKILYQILTIILILVM